MKTVRIFDLVQSLLSIQRKEETEKKDKIGVRRKAACDTDLVSAAWMSVEKQADS